MRRLVFAAALLLPACSSSSNPAPPPAASTVGCPPRLGAFTDQGLSIGDTCDASAIFLPRVRIAGAWHGGGDDGACHADATSVTCPTGSGDVRAESGAPDVALSFTASVDVTVEALALDGSAVLPGATAMLSNGFQSWSGSGVIALGPMLSDDALEAALAQRGDAEVLRDGRGLSWQLGYVGGGASNLFAGATSASKLRPWVAAGVVDGGGIRVRVGMGGGGTQVALAAGAKLQGESLALQLHGNLPSMLQRYADALPVHTVNGATAKAEAGWNSWYELWDGVDEAAVRANAPLAAQILTPLVPVDAKLRITVDDGWEKQWGDWVPNAKFPSGLDGLANDLKAQGFTMGVWLAPLLASEKSDVYTQHPDWFLPDATYPHPKNGKMHILDVTHPEAAAHLADVVSTIVSWGYSLLKIDFLFAGTYESARHDTATGMEAYDRALGIIRKAAGDGTVLVAVGAPALPTLAHVDGWRVGSDIALETTGPSWPLVAAQARMIYARLPFCAATSCDADPVLFRKLSEDEVGTAGWVVAFAGGALFLSDDLRKLDLSRVAWGLDAVRAKHALVGGPATPLDLFPDTPPAQLENMIVDLTKHSSSAVLPKKWRLTDGTTVALNVTDEEVTVAGVAVPPHAVRPLP